MATNVSIATKEKREVYQTFQMTILMTFVSI